MKEKFKVGILGLVVGMTGITLLSCSSSKNSEESTVSGHSYNVLFIAVDDLRPEIGAYGNSVIKTPNIDEFASTAVLFQNHYVQVPTCGASRASILTGRLPRTRAHLQNSALEEFMTNEPEKKVPESFVHHFRRNGMVRHSG